MMPMASAEIAALAAISPAIDAGSTPKLNAPWRGDA